MKTGQKDEGTTFTVLTKGKFSADLLTGHATVGAALGYQFAQRGSLAVSVFAGVDHSYSGSFRSGWDPIVGLKLRF